MAVGHFYSLDLRGHQLRHLAAGEGLHEHDMSNDAEDQRRQERHREVKGAARRAGSPLTTLRTGLRRATQRSVKSSAGCAQALRENLTEEAAVPRLSLLYASL